MAKQPYTYTPLLDREIRLLEIEPSLNDDAPLRGSLHTVCLDQGVVFSAMSYLWGDPAFNYNVTIDNCDVLITRNAFHALRDLRTSLQSKHKQFKYIWIDGLCIDQSNLEERGKQVRLMRDIYSKAEVVVIWLDQGIDPNSPAVEAMIQMDAHGCQLGQCEDHANQGLEFWEELFPALQDKYWQRVWTQQEMLLASEIVVHFRGVCFKGSPWLNLQFMIFNSYNGWLDLKSEIPDIMFELHRKYPEYPIAKTLRNTLVGARELLHKYGSENTQASSSESLLAFFSHVYALEATNDRDKLYEILGLINSIPESISVDYNLSTAQVYSQHFNHIIEQGKCLEFLCCVPNVDKSLPSWFPSLDRVDAAQWDLHSKQSACSNIPAVADIIYPGTILRARGFQVDVVLRKSEDELVSNSAVKWLGEVREMSQEAFLTSGGNSGSVDYAVAKLVFWWKSTALYSQFPLLASGYALADVEEEKRVAWTHLMEALDKNPELNLINLAAAHPPAEIKKKTYPFSDILHRHCKTNPLFPLVIEVCWV